MAPGAWESAQCTTGAGACPPAGLPPVAPTSGRHQPLRRAVRLPAVWYRSMRRDADEPDCRHHVGPAVRRRRPHGDRRWPGPGASRGRAPGRGRAHGAEPVREAGRGVSLHLADRRRHGPGRRTDRPGHHPSVSGLRRPPRGARVLADASDARVLRPLGRLLRDADPGPARQGGHSPPDHPRGRPPFPDEAGQAAVRHLGNHRAAAAQVGRNPLDRAASPASASSVPV